MIHRPPTGTPTYWLVPTADRAVALARRLEGIAIDELSIQEADSVSRRVESLLKSHLRAGQDASRGRGP